MSELNILDIVRASILADGSEAQPYSRHGGNSPIGVANPSLSDDGTKVAFVSDFLNLVPDDSNGQSDIFVKDMTTGAITRANTTADGAQSERSNGLDLPEKVAGGSSLSADGTKVAFWSAAPDLVPGDTNDMNGTVPGIDIFVKDLVTGAITRASTTTDGAQASGTSPFPDLSLSADGTKVAFVSDAPDLVLGDTNGESDIFVKDLTTGAIMRANTAADGTQGTGFYNLSPALSADGTKIAFVSDATNFVPGDTNNQTDVFVKNLATGMIERVSIMPDGAQASGLSYFPGLSADGTKVAFINEDDYQSNLFLRDLVTDTTLRVTDARSTNSPKLSADGSEVAFVSSDSDLVTGDNNNFSDIFVASVACGGDRALTGTNKADVLKCGVGNDIIEGRNGNDVLRGYSGGDELLGGNGGDSLDGGLGNDSLHGGRGNDRLWGGPGDDRLLGGKGADRMTGGPGHDVLIGGPGPDVFAIDSAASSPVGRGDVIVDFSRSAGDHIDLAAPFSHNEFQPVLFLEEEGAQFFDTDKPAVRWERVGPDVLVQADSDSNGNADLEFT